MDGVHSKRRSGCYIPKLHRFLHSPNRDDGGNGGGDDRDGVRHAHRGGVHAHHGRDDGHVHVHVHPLPHRDLQFLQSMKQR